MSMRINFIIVATSTNFSRYHSERDPCYTDDLLRDKLSTYVYGEQPTPAAGTNVALNPYAFSTTGLNATGNTKTTRLKDTDTENVSSRIKLGACADDVKQWRLEQTMTPEEWHNAQKRKNYEKKKEKLESEGKLEEWKDEKNAYNKERFKQKLAERNITEGPRRRGRPPKSSEKAKSSGDQSKTDTQQRPRKGRRAATGGDEHNTQFDLPEFTGSPTFFSEQIDMHESTIGTAGESPVPAIPRPPPAYPQPSSYASQGGSQSCLQQAPSRDSDLPNDMPYWTAPRERPHERTGGGPGRDFSSRTSSVQPSGYGQRTSSNELTERLVRQTTGLDLRDRWRNRTSSQEGRIGSSDRSSSTNSNTAADDSASRSKKKGGRGAK